MIRAYINGILAIRPTINGDKARRWGVHVHPIPSPFFAPSLLFKNPFKWCIGKAIIHRLYVIDYIGLQHDTSSTWLYACIKTDLCRYATISFSLTIGLYANVVHVQLLSRIKKGPNSHSQNKQCRAFSDSHL